MGNGREISGPIYVPTDVKITADNGAVLANGTVVAGGLLYVRVTFEAIGGPLPDPVPCNVALVTTAPPGPGMPLVTLSTPPDNVAPGEPPYNHRTGVYRQHTYLALVQTSGVRVRVTCYSGGAANAMDSSNYVTVDPYFAIVPFRP